MTIQIAPYPAPRPRVTRFGTYNSPKYTEWKQTLASLVRKQYTTITLSPVELEIVFIFTKPKSWSKKKAQSTRLHTIKPDIDNLAKAVMDALTGVIYKDDGQVCKLNLCKQYGAKESIELNITELRGVE